MTLPSSFDWNLLKLLAICSKHTNFKDAAQEAGITPSYLSKQIKKLESQLDVKLFERVVGNSCNVLTPNGEALLKKTLKINALVANKVSFEDPVLDLEDKRIDIFTTQGLAWFFLPKVIDAFTQKHPDCFLNIITNKIPPFLNPEAVILKAYFKVKNEIEKIKLFDIPKGFFASKAYVETHGNPETFDDAHKHHMLFSLGNRMTENLKEDHGTIFPYVTSNSIAFSYAFCLRGKGILELPTIFDQTKDLVQVFRKQKTYYDTLYLGCLPKRIRNHGVSLFVEFLMDSVKDFYPTS